ncbi:MAG TPA: peptidoglycan bridge formation glycyltransferase FemA/FemB family protein [Ktedonobacteraceae bacterium]|jgi:lipid II:glycine glycyltransferase (peptidoglycan interpeptide bridge formation enzyme)
MLVRSTSAESRLRLSVVTEEQRAQWDAFISTHSQGHIMQSWGWGELKGFSGWSPVRVALYDEEEHIQAAALVLCRTATHVPLRAAHLAYIPKGPVLDWHNAQLCQAFFSQLHPFLRKRGALALRMELGQEAEGSEAEMVLARLTPYAALPVRTVQPLRTILLDLTPSEEQLLARMKDKWRYNVRLAARKGVTIREAETLDDVRAWYQILQTTSARDQFGVHTQVYYEHAWSIFAPRGQARLLLAEYEGQILAGIFVTLFGSEGIYFYGASSNEQRQLMPNYLLQWEAIRWAKQRGATRYDFWGIPNTESEEEAMAGVYRFKRGWGGQVMQFLGGYEVVYRPLAMRLASRFIE